MKSSLPEAPRGGAPHGGATLAGIDSRLELHRLCAQLCLQPCLVVVVVVVAVVVVVVAVVVVVVVVVEVVVVEGSDVRGRGLIRGGVMLWGGRCWCVGYTWRVLGVRVGER